MKRLIRPVGVIVIAAVIGFVLARTLEAPHRRSSDALTRTVTGGVFAVRYPGDWSRTDPPPLANLPLNGRISLGPAGGGAPRLSIGTVRVATLGTLPAGFLRSVPGRPTPEIVALGPYRFDRYLDLRPHGAREVVSIYLLATARATIAATCESPRTSGRDTADCERVLGTLRLARGVKVEEGVDAAYALELNEILSTLNTARLADGPGLMAASLATRARAAGRLGAAESRAAAGAARLPAGIAVAANDTLVTSLQRAAGGYRALARAADGHDRAGYEAAQRTLRHAQQELTGAFKALARLGYRLQ